MYIIAQVFVLCLSNITQRLTVLDATQSVLRDMTSQEHCIHPQGMNFKDITKDTTQDTILDTLRYAKKCSIATVGLSVLCCSRRSWVDEVKGTCDMSIAMAEVERVALREGALA